MADRVAGMGAEQLLGLLGARRGHFRLESGHHGTLWLVMERLFARPRALRPLVQNLAERLAGYEVEVVCGPLIEGAFVGQVVAAELDAAFCYAEPVVEKRQGGLYQVAYRIPNGQREMVRGRRVAIVNDVNNAGSAVRGAHADLQACGARVVALGALLVLGEWSRRFAAEQGIGLETLAAAENEIWAPEACPLCAAGMAIDGEVDAGA